jgi:membrane protein implicated in regulation of membrane protease activity
MELYEAQALGLGFLFTALGLVSFLYVIATPVTTLTALVIAFIGIVLLFYGITFLRNRTVPQSSDESFYRLK